MHATDEPADVLVARPGVTDPSPPGQGFREEIRHECRTALAMQCRSAKALRPGAGDMSTGHFVGLAAVRDVINHQHPLPLYRDVQRFHQPRTPLAPRAGQVVNDPHAAQGHHVQGVGQQARRHRAAARNRHDHIRLESGFPDQGRQPVREARDLRPGQDVTTECFRHDDSE